MLNVRVLVLSGVLFTLCVSAANATPVLAPVIDGKIQAGDGYTLVKTDTPGETGYAPGLDIDKLQFAFDANYMYLGLTVTQPPLSLNGSGPNYSVDQATVFVFNMYNGDGSLYRKLRVYMTAPDDITAALYTSNKGSAVPIWTASNLNTDYLAVSPDTTYGGLEIKIPKTDLVNMPATVSFWAQLDDTGVYADDEISGTIPEPVTLSMLVLGGLAMLRRRRNG